MAKTQVVSVRLSVDVVAKLDEQAKAMGKTRADVVEVALMGTAPRAERPAGAERQAPAANGARLDTEDRGKGCAGCGGMNGLHQRTCKKTAS